MPQCGRRSGRTISALLITILTAPRCGDRWIPELTYRNTGALRTPLSRRPPSGIDGSPVLARRVQRAVCYDAAHDEPCCQHLPCPHARRRPMGDQRPNRSGVVARCQRSWPSGCPSSPARADGRRRGPHPAPRRPPPGWPRAHGGRGPRPPAGDGGEGLVPQHLRPELAAAQPDPPLGLSGHALGCG